MEIRHLRYFVAVAETRNFSRAAERCLVSQPSLSQQIRKLERQLATRLFDRLPRGVELTAAAEALLPRARRILAQIDALQAEVVDDLNAGRGRLVVGAIPTMAPFLLPGLLRDFLARFPACDIEVREDLTERLVEALLHHEIDVAITSTPIQDERLLVEVVDRERLLVIVPGDSPLCREASSLAIADLKQQPAVVLHEMHCLGQQIESFCASRRIIRRIVCRTTQLSTVQHLVRLGLGVSLIPEMCAKADRSEGCRYFRLGRAAPIREIALVRHTHRSVSQLCRSFMDLLHEHVADKRHHVT